MRVFLGALTACLALGVTGAQAARSPLLFAGPDGDAAITHAPFAFARERALPLSYERNSEQPAGATAAARPVPITATPAPAGAPAARPVAAAAVLPAPGGDTVVIGGGASAALSHPGMPAPTGPGGGQLLDGGGGGQVLPQRPQDDEVVTGALRGAAPCRSVYEVLVREGLYDFADLLKENLGGDFAMLLSPSSVVTVFAVSDAALAAAPPADRAAAARAAVAPRWALRAADLAGPGPNALSAATLSGDEAALATDGAAVARVAVGDRCAAVVRTNEDACAAVVHIVNRPLG